jgi:hypothetical protein
VQLTRHRFLLFFGVVYLSLPVDFLLMSCEVPPNVSAIKSNTMRISLKRSGGFTGIPLSITVDTTTLSPEETIQFQQMVEAADFFHLPATIPAAPQPDRFQYQVTVEEQDRTHRVSVGESAVPPTLKPLLNRLMDAARQNY